MRLSHKGPAPRPPYERVMERTIETPDGCVIFTGSINHARGGYGYIGVGSKADGTKSVRRTHIVVWEHHNGPISPGDYVCHSCDNPPCVNIEHLWLGDVRSNTRDAVEKGRMRSGARDGTCRSGKHEWTEENIVRWGGVARCRLCASRKAS